MNYNYSSLEAFAHDFSGNWRLFDGFTWHRTDISEPDKWGIIYTKHSQSTLLEIVNAQHLKHLLWVYLYHKSKRPRRHNQVYQIRDNHDPAGTVEGFLIRAYSSTGEITNACAALYDYLSALRDYPIADDEALDNLEAEIFADEWPDIMKSVASAFDGEHHPFYDNDCKFFIDLRTVADLSGISRLFRKHNPRKYWSSETGYFNISHFLYDITDGRITFEEMFSACPDSMTPTISAMLAECC